MIERTAAEQARHLRWHRRQQERVSPRTLLRESDELMYWLEECLVQRLRLIPGWLLPRLVRIVRLADPGLQEALQRERRPEQVMEVLFRAQEALMRQAIKWREPAKIIPLFANRAADPDPDPAADAGTEQVAAV